MADVMDMPIRIHKSEQTCAAGAAMFAATAAGIYSKVEDAMAAMGQGFDAVYTPDQSKVGLYKKRYEKFNKLGGLMETL
jgi:L-ribulokinase